MGWFASLVNWIDRVSGHFDEKKNELQSLLVSFQMQEDKKAEDRYLAVVSHVSNLFEGRYEIDVQQKLNSLFAYSGDLAAKVQALKFEIDKKTQAGDLSKALITRLPQEVQSLAKRIEDVQGQVLDVGKKIDSAIQELRNEIKSEHEKKLPASFNVFYNAFNRAPGITRKLSVRNDFDNICAHIEKQGLFFPRDLIKECCDALCDNRHLMLIGPPGTGKTKLGKILPSFFFPGNTNEILSYECANSSWDVMRFLGMTAFENDFLCTAPGVLTKAVVKCIERDGKHWLFVDEINRADIEGLLGGSLSSLTIYRDEPTFLQEPVYIAPSNSVNLQIPPSFRLICAMNEHEDQILYYMTEQIRERFRTVYVNPLNEQLTRKMLHFQIAHIWETIPSTPEVRDSIDRLTNIIESIRIIGTERKCPSCRLGNRLIEDTARKFLGKVATGNDPIVCLDEELSGAVIGRVIQAEFSTIETVLSRSFPDKKFTNCRKRLLNHLQRSIL
jgi:hypothetical protein